MHFNLHPPDTAYYVRRCEDGAITVVDRELRTSFVLSADRLVEPWPVHDVATLDADAIAPIVALEPEVVLLGTGARLRFPPQSVLAQFLTRGIGVEVMDNAAAARTFNVLAQEGRRVVAAFILP
ncbi:MAG TPA: Mth938-like domain-containing protein [Xanthomonadales bacterium]|nr:Mth938-like domain-containing protein [Xanthomonadales bacterium]